MSCAAVTGGSTGERSAVSGTDVVSEAGEDTGEASREVAVVTGVVVAGSPDEFNEGGAIVVDVPGSSVAEESSP